MKSAIFSDHQNAHFCLYDAQHGKGSCKDVRGQHKVLVDLPGLVKQVGKHYGPVALARAYADWSYFREYVPDLNRSLVELVHVPYVQQCKNSADMRLALDAYAETANAPDITTVVIFSCDSDFSDLAVRLRRLGKTVVGIGVEGANIRPEWVRACDKFYRYPVPKRDPEPTADPDRAATPAPLPPAPAMSGAVNGSPNGVAVTPIPLSHEVLALEAKRDDDDDHEEDEDEADETVADVVPVNRPPLWLGQRPSLNGSPPRFGLPSKSGQPASTPRPSSTPKPVSKPMGFPTYGSGPGQPSRPSSPSGGPNRPNGPAPRPNRPGSGPKPQPPEGDE